MALGARAGATARRGTSSTTRRASSRVDAATRGARATTTRAVRREFDVDAATREARDDDAMGDDATTTSRATMRAREIHALTRAGRRDAAAREGTASARAKPADAAVASAATTACFKAGDVDEGRAIMRRHRESVGDGKVGCVVLCAWATAESGTGTRDGDANARALLREATTTANGDARAVCDAWVALGNHELKHGRVDKARKCYKSALSAGEGAPASAAVAAHSWARLEAKERNPKLARELFAKSVDLCETHVANYTAWASFEMSRGQSDAARKLLERGAAFCKSAEELRQTNDSKTRRARSMASALFTSWGDIEGQIALRESEDSADALDIAVSKSRGMFERACAYDKKNVAAWLKWSELEKDIARGNSHRGGVVMSARRNSVSNRRQLDVLTAGLKANPGEMRLEHAYAMALKLNGDVEEATRRLHRLSERFQNNAHVWHALGTTLQESGDFQGAIAAFERGSFASGRANLPCITAAAAAELHGGKHGRARQLFVQGDSVPRHLSTRRERAAHLRLWALLEKRAGGEEVTRKLFIAATAEDRTDAATWLQWGQWEKRVNSVGAARKVFKDGIRYGVNNGQYFIYQALATLEAETNNHESARELFKQGCSAHPRSASLWLQWALFELSCGEDDKAASRNSIAVIEKGASRAPPHIPLLELWLNLERKAGDEHKARAVEDRLKKLLSEQRYAPVGHEVN